MPWMLYFHSGADSRKGKKPEVMREERIETLLGAVVSEVLMVVIVLDGMHLSSAGSFVGVLELSKALSIFGENASLLMGTGFIAAGFLALVVISLGSAWGVLEALNTTSRKSFLVVYTVESLPAVFLVAVSTSYVNLMLDLMVVFTIVILPSLYFLGRLVAREDVMNGHQYSRTWRLAFWIMSALIVLGGLVGLASFA